MEMNYTKSDQSPRWKMVALSFRTCVLNIARFVRALILITFTLMPLANEVSATDRRGYQHGLRFITGNDQQRWLIWSSSEGMPPKGETKIKLKDGSKCSYFTHDIFISRIDPQNMALKARVLYSMPEAQEPVDAAVTVDGSVAITYEDGSESNIANCSGVINQRYQVFNRFPDSLGELKTVAVRGAHSGHIAAVGDKFVITYAEGWMYGSGAGQAGTANDIYVDVISASGERLGHTAIAVDNGWLRDWWPLVAGSSRHALLVWQRLVQNSDSAQLAMAVYDPVNNKIIRPTRVLKDKLQYYHYDVQFLAGVNRFLITGNYLGSMLDGNAVTVITPKFFAFLLDELGNVVDYWENEMPCNACGSYVTANLVREARPAIVLNQNDTGNSVNVYYSVKPNGILQLIIDRNEIQGGSIKRVNHFWFPMGTDGLPLNDDLLFANLTPLGVKLIKVPAWLP